MFRSCLKQHQFPRKRLITACLTLFTSLNYSQSFVADTSLKPFSAGNVLLAEPKIAGNFGEFRGNHFHSGIDFKTNETEGWPVLAADEGYISRVKISSVGFGKAIYITHPSGIVTVYGHLRALMPALADSVEKLQFEKKQFEVELFPDSNLFPVNQGQLIGFSGNTGGSEGPHLHFETRFASNEKPFDPEIAGYTYADTIAPVLKTLVIYENYDVSGWQNLQRQIIEVDSTSKNIILPPISTTASEIKIGFEGYDVAGLEPNHLGLKFYRLRNDDSLLFECRIDSFLFDESRTVNAMIDYPYFAKNRRKFILCFKLKGNKVPLFTHENGTIKLQSGKNQRFILEVGDFKGNVSTIAFELQKSKSSKSSPHLKKQPSNILYGTRKDFKTENYEVTFQEKTFYEDQRIEVLTEKSTDSIFCSPIIKVIPDDLPVHESILIALKIASSKPEYKSKMAVVKIDSLNNISGVGGKVKGDWIKLTTKSLGKFSTIMDTLPPVAMTPEYRDDAHSGLKKLVLPLKGDLSGLKTYNCFINESWVCGEYNALRNEIELFFKFSLPPTGSTLRVELIDGVGNRSEFTWNLN